MFESMVQSFEIAGQAISLDYSQLGYKIAVPENYRRFILDRLPEERERIQFQVIPDVPLTEMAKKTIIFHTDLWNLVSVDGKLLFDFIIDPIYEGVLAFQYQPGELFGKILFKVRDGRSYYFPLVGPLDQVLFASAFAPLGGILVHACGIKYGNRALLFTGFSEAGKSTTARLWKDMPEVELLNDDRIMLLLRNGQVWAYGTPWNGSVQDKSPNGGPVDKIFFLQQAPQNKAVLLKPAIAASRLLARAFPTYWDKDCMEKILETVNTIVTNVPCYDYHFLPDKSAVDYIQCL